MGNDPEETNAGVGLFLEMLLEGVTEEWPHMYNVLRVTKRNIETPKEERPANLEEFNDEGEISAFWTPEGYQRYYAKAGKFILAQEQKLLFLKSIHSGVEAGGMSDTWIQNEQRIKDMEELISDMKRDLSEL